jgi:hypothetical protein
MFASWADKVFRLITTSPVAGESPGSYKKIGGPLFVKQGNTIVPTAWTAEFLSAMNPVRRLQQKFTGSGTRVYKPTTDDASQPPTEERGEAEPPPDLKPVEQDSIDHKVLAIGGVALVVVAGGGYLLWRKSK